jgi:hypothetical protein
VSSLVQESRDSTAEETAKWKISSRKNFSYICCPQGTARRLAVVRLIKVKYARIAKEEVRYKHASRNEHQSTVVECECAYIGKVSVY